MATHEFNSLRPITVVNTNIPSEIGIDLGCGRAKRLGSFGYESFTLGYYSFDYLVPYSAQKN